MNDPGVAKKPMTRWRQVKRVAALLAVTYLVFCGVARFAPNRFLFWPHAANYADGPSITKLTTADGVAIAAMYLPNRSARYTILFSHGNAEDLGDVSPDLMQLQGLGFGVLGYDYHGYGLSQGSPTEQNCYADIDAAYDFLTVTQKIPANRIIIFGRSIGSGPSLDLAARKPVAGLILQSAFTSAFHVHWLGYLLPGDRFRNIDKIAQVHCPLLIMHGRQDAIVPFAHGQRLFAAATAPKQCLWVDNAGHNDFVQVADKQYDQAIQDFAASLGSGLEPRP
jgi:fermentation-respiration switch protein FrsA (DUF1100 family)